MACSVFCQTNQPREWQPVQYEAVKELSKAVREGRIHNERTTRYCEGE